MSSTPSRWLKGPKPDKSVLELLEQIQIAARKGLVRSVSIVIVTPLLHTEEVSAGAEDPVRRAVLISGLAKATHKLITHTE